MGSGQECQAERDEGDSEKATAAEASGDGQRRVEVQNTREGGGARED